MPVLPRATTTIPRAGTAVRTIATRTTRSSTIDTVRARPVTSGQTADQPTTAARNSNPTVYRSEWTHWESSSHTPFTADDRARSFYSTQIYHGQTRSVSSTASVCSGPATGMGTGVPICAQMFGNECKANPTESEADVAADRCDEDPLPPELHHTIRLGAGSAAERPTESEEEVAADLGRYGEPPLYHHHK